MALALSVKDKPSQPSTAKANQPQGPSHDTTAGTQPSANQGQSIVSGTTAATVSRVRALYDFQPSEPGELQFRRGDIIAVLESVYKDWWKGSLRGQSGIFPLNYVEKLQDPTREEMERDAQMEAEVFGEIKNVEGTGFLQKITMAPITFYGLSAVGKASIARFVNLVAPLIPFK